MHYIAVAFLDMFPNSEHHSEISSLAKQFEVKEFTETRLISYNDLSVKFGFNGSNQIYRWDDSFVAIRPGENVFIIAAKSPEDAIPVGRNSVEIPTPICLGNLQVFRGTFQTKADGIEFHSGCAFIYPKKPGIDK